MHAMTCWRKSAFSLKMHIGVDACHASMHTCIHAFVSVSILIILSKLCVRRSTCLPACLSDNPCACPSIRMAACQSLCLSVFLGLSVFTSLYLSVFIIAALLPPSACPLFGCICRLQLSPPVHGRQRELEASYMGRACKHDSAGPTIGFHRSPAN